MTTMTLPLRRRMTTLLLADRTMQSIRTFSVQGLSWCGLNRNRSANVVQQPLTANHRSKVVDNGKVSSPSSLLFLSTSTTVANCPLGVVAAVSKNGIIGVNGSLPWSIPMDRQQFVDLTSDTILIVGRKTYFEQDPPVHVAHARCCIVVSTTLTVSDIPLHRSNGQDRPDCVRIVPSLEEALWLATELVERMNDCSSTSPSSVSCWIAGGQDLYTRALQHPWVQTVHLTVVDTEIDCTGSGVTEVARFPSRDLWDRHFVPVSRTVYSNVAMNRIVHHPPHDSVTNTTAAAMRTKTMTTTTTTITVHVLERRQ